MFTESSLLVLYY